MGLAAAITVIPHQGRSDLRSSFPRKMAAWRHPADVRFLVLHDNDGADCRQRKTGLLALAPADRRADCRVRIVMQELESWYLADLDALEEAGVIDARGRRALARPRYADSDAVPDPKSVIRRHVTRFGQISLAEAVAPHLRPERNRSTSFQHTVAALRWLTQR
jgi:hypothetical protein